MPKLDISVDDKFYKIWKKYFEERSEINKSRLVKRLIWEYFIKENVVKDDKKR